MEEKNVLKEKEESGSGALTVNASLEKYYNTVYGIDHVNNDCDEGDECCEEALEEDVDEKCAEKEIKDDVKDYFELTNDTITVKKHVLHRIKCTRDFKVGTRKVKKGDLGGFIEDFKNLQGGSWVFNDAAVLCDAIVDNGSIVENNSVVSGKAVVRQSIISDQAVVLGHAYCYDTFIDGLSRLKDSCGIYYSKIHNDVEITDTARVKHASLDGSIIVSNNANIEGTKDKRTNIGGNYKITRDAYIVDEDGVCSFSNFGSRNSLLTAYTTKYGGIRINTGCFHGDLDEFIKQVNKKPNGRIKDEYLAIAQVIKIRFIDHYLRDGNGNGSCINDDCRG